MKMAAPRRTDTSTMPPSRAASGIVARDGTAHFADAVRDFLLGEQHFRYIVMHGCPLRCFSQAARTHRRLGAQH